MGPNYIIALTKSQHMEILKNPQSSAEQTVNQQLIWLQQTSGEYQHWKTGQKNQDEGNIAEPIEIKIKFFGGDVQSKNKTTKQPTSHKLKA